MADARALQTTLRAGGWDTLARGLAKELRQGETTRTFRGVAFRFSTVTTEDHGPMWQCHSPNGTIAKEPYCICARSEYPFPTERGGMTGRLEVRLPDRVDRALHRAAKARGRTPSTLARTALQEMLEAWGYLP